MKSLTGTWFARSLEWLAGAILRHPKLFFFPQLGLMAVCVWYTAFSPWHLQFDTSRDNLVGANKKYHHNFLQFRKEFPEQDDLVVVVESEDMEKNRQFVERLGARLEVETNVFKDVFYKGDLKMMGNKALLFVPEKDLEDLRQTLKSYRPFIDQFTKATNLVSLFNLVNTQFRTARREENAENASFVKALPALERIVREADDGLSRPGAPPSPGIDALFGAGQEAERQMYITFADGQIFLVTTHAVNEQANELAVRRIRELMAQTQHEVPGVNAGATGEPILEIDEMAQSERDTLLATVVSLVLVFIIIVYGYGRVSRRLKADFCLLVGMTYTMAFTTLTVGHLNILTITFAPILIGLAIDFGVHLITRFEEELQHGRPELEAMTKAIVFTGQGIFTGAFTTAGAFLAMGLTDFKGIQEMGIICGGGMLVCLIPMMTMLPVMLLRSRPGVTGQPEGDPFDRRAHIESLWLARPGIVVVVTLVLCGLAVTQFRKVEFDYNLLDMQSKNLPAVMFEKKLIASAGKSVLFGAVLADSLDEANAIEEPKSKSCRRFRALNRCNRYFTEDQTRKLQFIGEIKQEVAPIRFAEYDPAPARVHELSATLYSLQGYCGAAAEEAVKDDAGLARQLLSLRDSINQFRKHMLADPPVAAERIAAFQQALFKDVSATFEALANQDNRGRLRADDLPSALRNRFVGVTGKYLIQVYPKEDIWKRENQKEFVHELRQALTPDDVGSPERPGFLKGLVGKLKRLAGEREVDDPNQITKPIITGTPVQLYEYTSLLVNSYIEATWYALGAIVLLVFFHFRTLSSLVLTLIPVAVGSIWLGGIMGCFGIPLNPANIMTLPLVIGIGVTNGIHILNRFAEEKTPGILAKSTGKAVLVSGLTAIAGFGSLILGKHQGIQSLGL